VTLQQEEGDRRTKARMKFKRTQHRDLTRSRKLRSPKSDSAFSRETPPAGSNRVTERRLHQFLKIEIGARRCPINCRGTGLSLTLVTKSIGKEGHRRWHFLGPFDCGAEKGRSSRGGGPLLFRRSTGSGAQQKASTCYRNASHQWKHQSGEGGKIFYFTMNTPGHDVVGGDRRGQNRHAPIQRRRDGAIRKP